MWHSQRRQSQTPPDGDWSTWYVRGGRGSGKTWTASHYLAELIERNPPGDWGVVAPSYGEMRDVCIEGPSGLLVALGGERGPWVKTWNRSLGELKLTNGATVFGDGADDGATTIQGKNLRGVWADEVGLWKVTQWEEAWEESIGFAVRLSPAVKIATGTPKRGHPLVRKLYGDARVAQTLLLTVDNADNLDSRQLQEWLNEYEGTTRGRQELYGEVLEDIEGALWTLKLIEDGRAYAPPFRRVVIGVDPAVSKTEKSDETGIIAAGLGVNGDGYVLADASLRGHPIEWARAAVDLYHQLQADRIVAEVNQGGEMVSQTIRTVDPNVPITLVRASKSKQARAEPIAAMYEQGRIHHLREHSFEKLETQMTTWSPRVEDSPDRVDALVWALTDLMQPGSPWGSGPLSSIA